MINRTLKQIVIQIGLVSDKQGIKKIIISSIDNI